MVDLEAAVVQVERLLALRGDSFRLLTRLGTLYHELDRNEDVVTCGERLFSLIRVEEPPDPDEEEKTTSDPWTSYGSYYRGSSNQYSQRVSAIRNYFTGKELVDEFVEIGQREVRLQPTNSALFGTVIGEMTKEPGQGPEALALVEVVRAGTLGRDHIPPSYNRANRTRNRRACLCRGVGSTLSSNMAVRQTGRCDRFWARRPRLRRPAEPGRSSSDCLRTCR